MVPECWSFSLTRLLVSLVPEGLDLGNNAQIHMTACLVLVGLLGSSPLFEINTSHACVYSMCNFVCKCVYSCACGSQMLVFVSSFIMFHVILRQDCSLNLELTISNRLPGQ